MNYDVVYRLEKKSRLKEVTGFTVKLQGFLFFQCKFSIN